MSIVFTGATLDRGCLLATCLGKPQLTALFRVDLKVAKSLQAFHGIKEREVSTKRNSIDEQ